MIKQVSDNRVNDLCNDVERAFNRVENPEVMNIITQNIAAVNQVQ